MPPASSARRSPARPTTALGAAALRVRWDRVGRVALLVLLLLVALAYVGPARSLLSTWQRLEREARAAADARARARDAAETRERAARPAHRRGRGATPRDGEAGRALLRRARTFRATERARQARSLARMHVDTALQLWSDGQRRLRAAAPDERRLLERVSDPSPTSCAAVSADRSRRASLPTSTAPAPTGASTSRSRPCQTIRARGMRRRPATRRSPATCARRPTGRAGAVATLTRSSGRISRSISHRNRTDGG